VGVMELVGLAAAMLFEVPSWVLGVEEDIQRIGVGYNLSERGMDVSGLVDGGDRNFGRDD
jgi:hypothetical protein